MKRRGLPALLVLAAVAGALAVLAPACNEPPRTPSAQERFERREGAEAIVIVHSRSGNTADMGRAIAGAIEADFVWLDVPEGSGDGWFETPGRDDEVAFEPARVDLAPYRLVLLGSPIWYRYPTAFAYSFLRTHDLVGRPVVLFYTFEGSIAGDAIAEWTGRVEAKGGRVVDVLGIDRDELPEGVSVAGEAERLVGERRVSWGVDRSRSRAQE